MTDGSTADVRAVAAGGRARSGRPRDHRHPQARCTRCTASTRTTRGTDRGTVPTGRRRALRRRRPSTSDRSTRPTPTRWSPCTAACPSAPGTCATSRPTRDPARDLERFVNVDHRDREALVAEYGGELHRGGRYERLGPGADEAEVAFVVEDAHQGRGLGSVLMEHLVARARQAGIARFVAEVLPANSRMMRVFTDAGYEVARRYADGVVHLTFPIAPTSRLMSVQWDRERRSRSRVRSHACCTRAGWPCSARAPTAPVWARRCCGICATGGYAGPVFPVHRRDPTDRGPAGRSKS